MNDEQLKKIIQKSTVETSADFTDNLMNAIHAKKEAENARKLPSFQLVFGSCIALIVGVTFVLFKYLGIETDMATSFAKIPRTPVFIVVTLVFLYYLNVIISLKNTMRS